MSHHFRTKVTLHAALQNALALAGAVCVPSGPGVRRAAPLLSQLHNP
jgi:hypothetical protein